MGVVGGQSSIDTPNVHSKMWMAARIIGVLFLIVVPGLVLGVMTGQLPWGIALSGAIATVLSLLAVFTTM